MADKIIEKLEKDFNVKFDTYWKSYPDVTFEIILEEKPTNEQIAIAVNTLESFVENYNKIHFLRPIHYISDIDSLPGGDSPRGIYIDIDFGNCSPRALILAIRALQKTQLNITNINLS